MAISNAMLAGLTRTQLLEMHYKMTLLRRFEEKSAEEYTRGKIGGFMHLYIGQEAIGVGSIATLRKTDKILCSYREHGHALAKGMSARAVMAELFGKATGCSKGKGGSMHSIPTEQVDGMNVIAVYEAAKRAVEYARSRQGPTLLEVKTYRFRAHSMTDPAYYRTREEEQKWRTQRDPIGILEKMLLEH